MTVETEMEPAARSDTSVREAIRRTAAALNDTVAVTKGSYVHPAVLEARPEQPVAPPGASSKRSQPAEPLPGGERPIKRRDELAVLATLRESGRTTARNARSPQVAGAGGAVRTRARRA